MFKFSSTKENDTVIYYNNVIRYFSILYSTFVSENLSKVIMPVNQKNILFYRFSEDVCSISYKCQDKKGV